MTQKRIAVRVAPDGTVTAETIGFKGAACLDSVGLLEDLLEATAVDSRFTRDYDAIAEASPVRTAVDETETVHDQAW